jgi:hypothetical protein
MLLSFENIALFADLFASAQNTGRCAGTPCGTVSVSASGYVRRRVKSGRTVLIGFISEEAFYPTDNEWDRSVVYGSARVLFYS